jgi:hypothetical protein
VSGYMRCRRYGAHGRQVLSGAWCLRSIGIGWRLVASASCGWLGAAGPALMCFRCGVTQRGSARVWDVDPRRPHLSRFFSRSCMGTRSG